MEHPVSTVTSSGTSEQTSSASPAAHGQTATVPSRIRLTPIKIEMVRAVLKYRLLTIDQIQRLCLPCGSGQSRKGRLEYTRHLLRVLYQHQYLVRRRLIQANVGRQPLVFAGTWKGAQAVAAHDDCHPQDLGWDPYDKVITWANENLQHLITENEVNILFAQACAQTQIELREWKSDRTLQQEHKGKKVRYIGPHGGMYEKVIIPDGYYVFARPITVNGKTGTVLDRLLVEIDLGTQTLKQRQQTIKHPQRTWEHKVKAYLAFFKPGGLFEQLYGSSKGRVLVITTSERRLLDMKQVTEDAGGNARFWFTTFVAFTSTTALTAPIYRIATKGETQYSLLDDPVDR